MRQGKGESGESRSVHSVHILSLLSTAKHLRCLCGVPSQTHRVIYEQLRGKNQLGQGHPAFQAKGSASPFAATHVIFLSQAHGRGDLPHPTCRLYCREQLQSFPSPFSSFLPKGGGGNETGDSPSTAGSPVSGDGAMELGAWLMRGLLFCFLGSACPALGHLSLTSPGSCLLPSLCPSSSGCVRMALRIFSSGGSSKIGTLASSPR